MCHRPPIWPPRYAKEQSMAKTHRTILQYSLGQIVGRCSIIGVLLVSFGCTSMLARSELAEAQIEACMNQFLGGLADESIDFFVDPDGGPSEASLGILKRCSTPFERSWEGSLASFHNKRLTACRLQHWPIDYFVLYVDINYADHIAGDPSIGASAWVDRGTQPRFDWRWTEVDEQCKWVTVGKTGLPVGLVPRSVLDELDRRASRVIGR